jgi:hypothetical protein
MAVSKIDSWLILNNTSYKLASAVGPKYWNKLKERLVIEGNETVTNCDQLKMFAADGKMRFTDVADTEQLFRVFLPNSWFVKTKNHGGTC